MDFGIGFSELVVIGVLILVFFGSKELPNFVRQFAKILAKVRKYTDAVKRELNDVTRSLDLKGEGATTYTNDTAEKKKTLRPVYQEIIAKLTPEERAEKSRLIFEHIQSIPEFVKAKAVMVYVSFGNEVDTYPIMDAILAAGKRLIVPFCRSAENTGLGIAAITAPKTELLPGTFSIPEPIESLRENFFKSDLNLILCPGLAFDGNGVRLGRGKGMYDYFLRELKGKVPIFGLCFHNQFATEHLPNYYHDIAVDQVVSEKGLLIDKTPAADL
jgi:5-formyltetrahydrofolate cyclo-ligase